MDQQQCAHGRWVSYQYIEADMPQNLCADCGQRMPAVAERNKLSHSTDASGTNIFVPAGCDAELVVAMAGPAGYVGLWSIKAGVPGPIQPALQRQLAAMHVPQAAGSSGPTQCRCSGRAP